MEALFETTKQKYINLKGYANYQKLYDKIYNSKALSEICGISVRRGLPPMAGDFTYKASLMPTIYISFDMAKSSMAALIMLKIWNDRVNSVYHMCTKDVVVRMARQIIAESISLY